MDPLKSICRNRVFFLVFFNNQTELDCFQNFGKIDFFHHLDTAGPFSRNARIRLFFSLIGRYRTVFNISTFFINRTELDGFHENDFKVNRAAFNFFQQFGDDDFFHQYWALPGV